MSRAELNIACCFAIRAWSFIADFRSLLVACSVIEHAWNVRARLLLYLISLGTPICFSPPVRARAFAGTQVQETEE